MNKQMKQSLEAVVTALVEQDSAAATAAFHEYLRMKSQAILVGESAEDEDEEDEDKKASKKDEDADDEEDDEKKDEDKDEKKSKKEDDCDM